MLDVARRKPGAERVRWIEGGAAQVPAEDADLALMSGHVAQFFLTDIEWSTALRDLGNGLRDGGRLAFESRNPEAKAWKGWTASQRRTVVDPEHGPIDCWTEVVDERPGGIVSTVVHRRLQHSGDDLASPVSLRFRGRDELVDSLVGAGFVVDSVLGNWRRGPAGADEPELIVLATRVA